MCVISGEVGPPEEPRKTTKQMAGSGQQVGSPHQAGAESQGGRVSRRLPALPARSLFLGLPQNRALLRLLPSRSGCSPEAPGEGQPLFGARWASCSCPAVQPPVCTPLCWAWPWGAERMCLLKEGPQPSVGTPC